VRVVTPPEDPGLPSAEQRLMELADAADRARRALGLWADARILTPAHRRPEPLPDGRLAVDPAAWDAWAGARDAVGALIRLAAGERD
jgi:hypothetical protein